MQSFRAINSTEMYIIYSSDDEDTADDRAITAVGLLNTLETMLGKFSRTSFPTKVSIF